LSQHWQSKPSIPTPSSSYRRRSATLLVISASLFNKSLLLRSRLSEAGRWSSGSGGLIRGMLNVSSDFLATPSGGCSSGLPALDALRSDGSEECAAFDAAVPTAAALRYCRRPKLAAFASNPLLLTARARIAASLDSASGCACGGAESLSGTVSARWNSAA
jgi:hypothetical protein